MDNILYYHCRAQLFVKESLVETFPDFNDCARVDQNRVAQRGVGSRRVQFVVLQSRLLFCCDAGSFYSCCVGCHAQLLKCSFGKAVSGLMVKI